ncbi:hypothetical protein [Legionella hackeliae]|uniref:Uncharacterized protein n=1 Tax=Legionella hackeliae TaxID=449 RepID=A0A0A8UNY8_LEGHA|nr:hypothetical protein [Legionella hackeliae]KTD12907.1 RNA binding protein (contains ribosomal protein S1 domain) [Legionella hackeliae]CEK09216.1 protein of unknown function [Legionella hackeliae]STX49123.1 RNA binding protein (contains ribosomal protein S1 domain) [Legionella hackeliae]
MELEIVYYGDLLPDSYHEKLITVFVLAHGHLTDPTIVASHAKPKHATVISIDTLATRFTCDFTLVSSNLVDIHLYCCGENKKNEVLATSFQQSLLPLQRNRIQYYEGIIYAPDRQGKFWSVTNNGNKVPVIGKLLQSKPDVTIENKENTRTHVKGMTVRTSYQLDKENRKKSCVSSPKNKRRSYAHK